MIKLGDKVKCRMTGFTGIVTGICTYMYRETSYGIEPDATKADGSLWDPVWFPEPRLEVVA